MSSNGFVTMADRVFPAIDEGALTGIASHTSIISSSNAGSEPLIPPDSPGSCVSSRLQVTIEPHRHAHSIVISDS